MADERTAAILAAIPTLDRDRLAGLITGLISEIDRQHTRYSALLPPIQADYSADDHLKRMVYEPVTHSLYTLLTYAHARATYQP